MLFYNHKQEFIGIDEEGLRLLNYDSLEALLEVCSDAADLFAKEPGYVHNFKNFGWIDFLLHADSAASSAIVHANGRTFSCSLQVHKLYLCAEPAHNGYMVEMLHVVPISGEEIPSRPPITPPKTVFEPKIQPPREAAPASVESSVLPDYGHLTPTPLSEPGTLDIPEYAEPEFDTFKQPSEDLYEKPYFPEPAEEAHEELLAAVAPAAPRAPRPGLRFTADEQRFIDELKVDPSYRFDPSVAANELGLPVDLIQEFIGDFIQQSHDFKNDLFEAVMKGDIGNLKILSHKLKGVAANLRIEDALECLGIINTSDDIIEIEANLKYFYGIIDKLEGKEPAIQVNAEPYAEPAPTETVGDTFARTESYPQFEEVSKPSYQPEPQNAFNLDDDIYTFGFKEEKEETVMPVVAEQPDYSVGLKHGEEDTLIVQPDELIPPVQSEEQTFAYSEPETFEEPAVTQTSAPEPLVEKLHYDKAAVAGQLGIETAFFDELIDDYRHDALIAEQEIAAAIAAFDTHRWKKTASQLKGISDNLRLSEISDELAILSRTNDAQEAHKASKRLTSYLEQL